MTRRFWKDSKLYTPTIGERKRHINFLCRPSAPGLSLVCRASTVKNKEKTWVCPRFSPDSSQGQTGLVPRTNPGLSQDQPGKKVHVYVPFSSLNRVSGFSGVWKTVPCTVCMHTKRVVRQHALLRRVLTRVLETAFEKVLRRCLAMGFRGRKGSKRGLLRRHSKVRHISFREYNPLCVHPNSPAES